MAPRCCGAGRDCAWRRSGSPRFGKRLDQLARFELGRIQDHLLAGHTELPDVPALDVLKLDRQDAGFLPLAGRSEFHVAYDRGVLPERLWISLGIACFVSARLGRSIGARARIVAVK